MSNTRTANAKKTPWLLVILLVLVAAASSAAGMYFLMGKGNGTDEATKTEPLSTPIFVPLPPFTVNLRSEQHAERLLYIGLSLQVANKASEEFLKQYMPQVRSRLLKLFSAQSAAELLTPNGKETLSAKILDQLRAPITTPQPALQLNDVLYTDFIVQ